MIVVAKKYIYVVSTHFMGQLTDFYRKVKKDFYFKELDFNAQ